MGLVSHFLTHGNFEDQYQYKDKMITSIDFEIDEFEAKVTKLKEEKQHMKEEIDLAKRKELILSNIKIILEYSRDCGWPRLLLGTCPLCLCQGQAFQYTYSERRREKKRDKISVNDGQKCLQLPPHKPT